MISTTMFDGLVLIFVAGETAIFDVAIDPARCWLSQRLWHPLLQRGWWIQYAGEQRNMDNSCGSIMFNPALWFNPAFLLELTWFSHQKVKIKHDLPMKHGNQLDSFNIQSDLAVSKDLDQTTSKLTMNFGIFV